MKTISFITRLVGATILAFSLGTLILPLKAEAFGGCTKQKNKMVAAKKKYGKKNGKWHAAYANGTGLTLTGIKGCGWVIKSSSASRAKSIAMKYCRKHGKNCKITVYFRW